MRLSRFCNDLTSKQIVSLSELLKIVKKRTFTSKQTDDSQEAKDLPSVDKTTDVCMKDSNSSMASSDKIAPLQIPSTTNEFRQLFYGGKHCIESNLPKPTIHRAGEYAFVYVQDCIAHLLAHGAEVDNLLVDSEFKYLRFGNPKFRDSPRVGKVKERWIKKIPVDNRNEVIMLWLSWWADAFEPNSSNKQNRLSVWIKTMTFSKPASLAGNDITNTFPIAIGPKNGDKNSVEEAIMKNLSALSLDNVADYRDLPRMFDKRSGRMKYVCAMVAICIHDQIDRRGVLNLAFGNGKYHGMFGWSYDFGRKYASIVACDNCQKSMLSEAFNQQRFKFFREYSWRNGDCPRCSAWFFHKSHDVLSYPIPRELKKCFDGGEMSPSKLSFTHLKQCIVLAHHKFVQQKWNVSETTAFLKMNCFSSEFIERVLEHGNASIIKAANELSLDDIGLNVPLMLETNDGQDNIIEDFNHEEELAKQKIERAMLNNPALFDRVKPPPLWTGDIDMDAYVESPMHLLFLGIVESVVKLVHDWLCRRRQLSLFVSYADKVMPELIGLNLPWCKLLVYGTSGKFGGWVSENFLGFSRLLKWFYYTPIKQLPELTTDYEIPSTPVNTWDVLTCNAFMNNFGVVCDGTISDKRREIDKRLTEIYSDNLPTRRASKDEVLNMISTLSDMLEVAMDIHPDSHTNLYLEVRVRLFLHAVHKFDCNFNKYPVGHDKYTPIWVTKYNFLSLLKLPDTIRQFGPLRNYWEGGAIGEGFLRSIKPEIKRGLRYNWQRWILNNFLQNKAYDMVSRNFEDSSDKADNAGGTKLKHCALEFKIYSSAAVAIRKFHSGVPISFVQTEAGFGMVYRSDKSSIRLIGMRGREFKGLINGLAYFHFSLEDDEEHIRLADIPSDHSKIGGILLPAVMSFKRI